VRRLSGVERGMPLLLLLRLLYLAESAGTMWEARATVRIRLRVLVGMFEFPSSRRGDCLFCLFLIVLSPVDPILLNLETFFLSFTRTDVIIVLLLPNLIYVLTVMAIVPLHNFLLLRAALSFIYR
jgi:hypothetical protein